MDLVMPINELLKLQHFLKCKGFTPHTIELLISSKCNLRCKICNVWLFQTKARSNKYQELSTSEVENFLEEIGRLGAKYLCLSGGEPTLRRDLIKIIQKAKDENLKVELITNGTTLNKNLAEGLVKSDLDIITISLDSARSYPHDFIRGVEGSWEKTIKGIKHINYFKAKLNLKSPKISIDYVVTNLNYIFIPEIIDLRKELKFDNIHFLPIIPKTSRAKHLLLTQNNLNELSEILPLIKHKIERNKLPTSSIVTLVYICRYRDAATKGLYSYPTRSQIICLQPWYMASVDPFGNVYPCCYACTFQNLPDGHINEQEISKNKFIMGNIKVDPFEEIWNGNKFMRFRNMCKKPLAFNFCRFCNYTVVKDMFYTGLFLKPTFLLKHINERILLRLNPLKTRYSYW